MPESPSPQEGQELSQSEVTDDIELDKKEQREERIQDLIKHYAALEEERLEQDLEDSGTEGQEKRELKEKYTKWYKTFKKGLIKLGIGVAIGTVTVATGGLAVAPAAIASIGAGLLVSSVAKGATEVVRTRVGKEYKQQIKQDEELVAQKHRERETELMRLALIAREARDSGDINRETSSKLELVEYANQISNPEDDTNAEVKAAEERIKKHSTKWKWIKLGVSIASGVLAGGAVAKGFENLITENVEEAGVHVVGEGLFTEGGQNAAYEADIDMDPTTSEFDNDVSSGHIVRENDAGGMEYEYNKGDLDLVNQVRAADPKFAEAAPLDEAEGGIHAAGEGIRDKFNARVEEVVNDKMTGLYTGVNIAVAASEIASDSLFNKTSDEKDADYYRGEAGEVGRNAEKHVTDITTNWNRQLYEQTAATVEGFPAEGSVVSNISLVSVPTNTEQTEFFDVEAGGHFTFELTAGGRVTIQVSDESGVRNDNVPPISITRDQFVERFVDQAPGAGAGEPDSEIVKFTDGSTGEETDAPVATESATPDQSTDTAFDMASYESKRAEDTPERPIDLRNEFDKGEVWIGSPEQQKIAGGKLMHVDILGPDGNKISETDIRSFGHRYVIENTDFNKQEVDFHLEGKGAVMRADLNEFLEIFNPDIPDEFIKEGGPTKNDMVQAVKDNARSRIDNIRKNTSTEVVHVEGSDKGELRNVEAEREVAKSVTPEHQGVKPEETIERHPDDVAISSAKEVIDEAKANAKNPEIQRTKNALEYNRAKTVSDAMADRKPGPGQGEWDGDLAYDGEDQNSGGLAVPDGDIVRDERNVAKEKSEKHQGVDPAEAIIRRDSDKLAHNEKKSEEIAKEQTERLPHSHLTEMVDKVHGAGGRTRDIVDAQTIQRMNQLGGLSRRNQDSLSDSEWNELMELKVEAAWEMTNWLFKQNRGPETHPARQEKMNVFKKANADLDNIEEPDTLEYGPERSKYVNNLALEKEVISKSGDVKEIIPKTLKDSIEALDKPMSEWERLDTSRDWNQLMDLKTEAAWEMTNWLQKKSVETDDGIDISQLALEYKSGEKILIKPGLEFEWGEEGEELHGKIERIRTSGEEYIISFEDGVEHIAPIDQWTEYFENNKTRFKE